MSFISSDELLAVEAAMSVDEKERFLATLNRLNPHSVGAQVADYLDQLANTDARLDVTEPLYEDHPEYSGSHLDLAIYVAIYAYGAQTPEEAWPIAREFMGRLQRTITPDQLTQALHLMRHEHGDLWPVSDSCGCADWKHTLWQNLTKLETPT